MEKSKVKSIVIALLALALVLLGTCEVRHRINEPDSNSKTDPLLGDFYKREKEQQIAVYQNKIGRLQQQKDSLWFLVAVKKHFFLQIRPKVKQYQSQLKQQLQKPDSVFVGRDILMSIADSLVFFQQKADSSCLETIDGLEQLLANRDSCISVQRLVEVNLRDIQKEQDLKAQYLTEQLNTALKLQRKKVRQNKLLAGGILLLSGITSAVLMPHYLK